MEEDKNRKRGIRRAYNSKLRKRAIKEMNEYITRYTLYYEHTGSAFAYNYISPVSLEQLKRHFMRNRYQSGKRDVKSCDCYCEYKKGECKHCKRIARWKAGELRMNDEYDEWLYE